MKKHSKKSLLLLCGGLSIQAILIFFSIYHQSRYVEQLYIKQKNEKLLKELGGKKQQLTQDFFELQNRALLYDHATQQRSMRPIRIGDIQKI